MAFDLPAADADRSLKQFAARSGLEVVFVSASVANVRTSEAEQVSRRIWRAGLWQPKEVLRCRQKQTEKQSVYY